jgi:LmbE family N-acetylglucosaminyl deacetylase
MSKLRGSRIVVLSPHLDDGVFSLGASVARAAREGAQVKVVTVFANEPASDRAASPWDLTCGFRSEGEAATGRRDEDRRARRLVGAEPVWLPFRDAEYGRETTGGEVWDAVAGIVAWGDSVMCPGFPLEHVDHEWLTALAVRHVPPDRQFGLYVEQPYASWRLIGRGRRTWAMPGLTLRRGSSTSSQSWLEPPRGDGCSGLLCRRSSPSRACASRLGRVRAPALRTGGRSCAQCGPTSRSSGSSGRSCRPGWPSKSSDGAARGLPGSTGDGAPRSARAHSARGRCPGTGSRS